MNFPGGQYFAPGVILATFIWSAITVANNRVKEAPPGTITIRIGHWQLESGVRDALNAMASEYQKLHPNVRVIQDAIPEATYPQWIGTQLLGGTAPDLIEMGNKIAPAHLLYSYYNRYCVTLTSYVGAPNPYNKGTNFETVPLRLTFKDGMRNAYIEELQAFMNIPLSQFNIRIFYNKELLKKLTGLDKPPQNYREFLAACEKIRTQKNDDGLAYTPIAGSKYHLPHWEAMMFESLTYGAGRMLDYSRDASVTSEELYAGFKIGKVNFESPFYKGQFKMMAEVTQYFQSGFAGLTRDEAVFLFAQARAVFITTGTWDAKSLQDQMQGNFEVGVADFPAPSRDDPEFGALMEGPVYENPEGGFPFAVTRTSKHPEIAIDFLLFMASKRNNEELNRIIGWIPCIRETKMAPILSDFSPHLEGVYRATDFKLGAETRVKYEQVYSAFQSNLRRPGVKLDEAFDRPDGIYKKMTSEFSKFYLEQGEHDFYDKIQEGFRGVISTEQLRAGARAAIFFGPPENKESSWIRYRTLMAGRQTGRDFDLKRLLHLVEDGTDANAPGPYEYNAHALEKIRAAAQRSSTPAPVIQ